MLSTVPEAELVSTKSPDLNGLENNIINPPARFDRLFCKASPIASPAALKQL